MKFTASEIIFYLCVQILMGLFWIIFCMFLKKEPEYNCKGQEQFIMTSILTCAKEYPDNPEAVFKCRDAIISSICEKKI